MRDARVRDFGRLLGVAVPTLALATAAIAVLQDRLGVPNPSAVYLVAVVATAIISGTLGAIATSVAAFVLYTYLFTEPRNTFHIEDPGVLVSVLLLLFVGVVVGQLTARQRSRADAARQREQEARALFSISRRLVTRDSVQAVLGEICAALQREARMSAVWVTLGLPEGGDPIGVVNQLRRMPAETPPQWVRVHQPAGRARTHKDRDTFRVAIESGTDMVGAIWASRPRDAGPPNAHETRLLAATADQLGQAIAHDRMAADSQSAEVARESDALKSALLQSVSHDLRTPLATIRAAAGTLRSGTVDFHADSDGHESLDAIDREVEYLNRLVTNLLDLSRIEAGVLRPELDTFELDDLVRPTIERLDARLAGWTLQVQVGAYLVEADPVLFDAVLTNVLENSVRHTMPGTTIRLSSADPGEMTRLIIEDSGTGVTDDVLDTIFEKFYRAPTRNSSRSGTGIGLAVARGFVEAIGGRIEAHRSKLGGLA
ncbi:MAG TPA: DUF4118 domain-containing protein, partial [Candidatus Limnocylindrales bacterium]|nr:DUF4118 domain-containing protein [Candidatus Limnocylindrales bacterium]